MTIGTAACLSGRSKATAASSADPTRTEHRRACPGLDPGGPERSSGAIAGKEFLVTLVMTIVDTKVPKKAARTSPPGLRPGPLRCSRLAGIAELAPVATLPPLRHAALDCHHNRSANRSAPRAALTAGHVKGQPEPPSGHCSTPAPWTRSEVLLSIETRLHTLHRTEPGPSGLGCGFGFAFEDLKGAEKRRGGRTIVITIRRCMSERKERSDCSEFSGPRPHRASQGTRSAARATLRERSFWLRLS